MKFIRNKNETTIDNIIPLRGSFLTELLTVDFIISNEMCKINGAT